MLLSLAAANIQPFFNHATLFEELSLAFHNTNSKPAANQSFTAKIFFDFNNNSDTVIQ
ncbi:hypothetical protein CLV82_1267 [Zeaxanthinibacter enoshimensis]|uniref:Uncharacterized protein n=1 Tax=Zeaxanthinibacter enoshimensis TaxID=392009 RepID=A0A4R6TSY0_9FLAO|nr:hypothetical protein CLV82_1267 [Zeaxanthinibacter enoshimensis]